MRQSLINRKNIASWVVCFLFLSNQIKHVLIDLLFHACEIVCEICSPRWTNASSKEQKVFWGLFWMYRKYIMHTVFNRFSIILHCELRSRSIYTIKLRNSTDDVMIFISGPYINVLLILGEFLLENWIPRFNFSPRVEMLSHSYFCELVGCACLIPG